MVLLLVAGLAWIARDAADQRHELPDGGWGTLDADTFYHLRRADRALTEGLPPAGTDSYLNHPEGSAIPWPPYYAIVGWAAATPGAPDDPEARRAHVERRVASLPMAIGVGTSVLAGVAGAALAGPVGAILAGGNHALCFGSLVYTRAGNGDHHAWVTMLHLLMLMLLSAGLARGAADRRRPAMVWGAAAGAVAGLAVGSWVGFVLHVLPVQLMFGAMILASGRRDRPGTAAFGAAFHVAALLVVLPAAAVSPWNAVQPGSVVNLSWFHPVWLAAGALVFAPMFFLRGGTVAARLHPFAVLLGLGAIGLFLAASGSGVAVAMREAFQWLGREDEFMGSVWESRGVGLHEAGILLGRAYYLLPLVVAGAAFAVVRRGRWELLPWTFAVPVLAVEAARQYRFNETLTASWSVLLAWGVVAAFRSDAVRSRLRFVPAGATLPAALIACLVFLGLTHRQSVRETMEGLRQDVPVGDALSREMRDLCEWLRLRAPGDEAVLADWNFGHLVEWVADRPTVGTNFGIYVGEDSFRDGARFFLETDPAAAMDLLRRRDVRFVLQTGWQPRFLEQMVRAARPSSPERFLVRSGEGSQVGPAWFETMSARLLFNGSVVSPAGDVGPPLSTLRLVHVSPSPFPEPMFNEVRPAGWIWERVPGAALTVAGVPGDTLQVEIPVRYEPADFELTWWAEATAGDDGTATVRIPYATDTPNGDGRATGPARVRMGSRRGEVAIPEAAVRGGGALRLD